MPPPEKAMLLHWEVVKQDAFLMITCAPCVLAVNAIVCSAEAGYSFASTITLPPEKAMDCNSEIVFFIRDI